MRSPILNFPVPTAPAGSKWQPQDPVRAGIPLSSAPAEQGYHRDTTGGVLGVGIICSLNPETL